jgi:hypothetical protein
LPHFQGAIYDRILNVLPRPGSSAANPVDVANPFVHPTTLREVLMAAGEDPRVDLQLMVPLLYHYKSLALQLGASSVKAITPFGELAQALREAWDKTGKPVIAVLPNPKQGLDSMDIEEMLREARQAFLACGIPVFEDVRRAFQAVAHVSRFALDQSATITFRGSI